MLKQGTKGAMNCAGRVAGRCHGLVRDGCAHSEQRTEASGEVQCRCDVHVIDYNGQWWQN